MGQVLDRLHRLQHHDNKIEQLENNILEYEQLMEQWLVNNSCCEITPYNKNEYKQMNRYMETKEYIAKNINRQQPEFWCSRRVNLSKRITAAIFCLIGQMNIR